MSPANRVATVPGSWPDKGSGDTMCPSTTVSDMLCILYIVDFA